MAATHDFDNSFIELAATVPKTKSGQVRAMLSQIEQAISEGKTIKEIWLKLSKDGFPVSYRAFTVYIHRARRARRLQAAATAAPKQPEERATTVASTPMPPADFEEDVLDPRDPMFNVLNAERNRRGFFYPGTQSADELVHGRKKR